jgi:nucleotide-binding universal stress UspA family protein
MFKHILLPTDGSKLSEAAIQQGIRFAKSIGAQVTGLCVMPLQETFFYETEIPGEALELATQPCRELAETYLAVIEKAAKEARAECKMNAKIHLTALTKVARGAGVACDVVMETSDQPYEAIVNVAENKGCDLIMMASHGRKGVKGLLIGSETQKVLTHSKIPVLVYR